MEKNRSVKDKVLPCKFLKCFIPLYLECMCMWVFFLIFCPSNVDRESPCHVKLLRAQNVVYISCGNEHTAVLTKVKEHLACLSLDSGASRK